MSYRVGDLIEQRWEVWRVLQGGLGRVYLVYDHALGEPFAVKTFLLDEPEVVERFLVESTLWARLDRHAHIVAMDSFKVINGRPHLFLELVDGGDLSGWIGTERLDLTTVLRLGMQFCDGMTHAYDHGLEAHRDIKPQNCLLTSSGDHLKITDFGLARVAKKPAPDERAFSHWISELLQGRTDAPPPSDPKRTRPGQALGTAAYMAPEQWRDAASADRRADVYSFGVMLYEMLVGKLPFWSESHFTLCYQHCCAAPPQLPPELPEALDALVLSCLAKLPEQRPADFRPIRARLAALYAQRTGKPAPEPVTGPVLDALELCNKGASLLNMGRLEEGLAVLDRSLARRDDLAHAWVNRALGLRLLGRPKEAVQACDRAIHCGELSDAWAELGTNLALLGDERAESCFRRGLELNAYNPNVWHNLGVYQAGRGNLADAVECLRRALTLKPHDAEPWVVLGMAYFNQGKLSEAEASLRNCLAHHPRHARGWSYLGMCLWEQGRREESGPCYQRALEEEPRLGSAWLGLARCTVHARHYAEALPMLERSLQLEPGEPMAWHVLGTCLVMLGRNSEAIAPLERAVELDPSDAEGWFVLGQLYLHASRLQEAQRAVHRGALLGHPRAAELLTRFRTG